MGGMAEGQANAPVTAGPKRVFGLLSNVDIHRVRTGNPPSRSQIAGVGRRQRLGAYPSRFNSGERDLEVDQLGTRGRTLELAPYGEALADKGFRAGLINVVADGGLALELNTTDLRLKSIIRASKRMGTYNEFDFLKSSQIIFIKLDGSADDSSPAVPGRTLDLDGVLVMKADGHIFNPFRPHAGAPSVNGAARDELEALLASRGIWAVIWNG